jgi:hypothetical protein
MLHHSFGAADSVINYEDTARDARAGQAAIHVVHVGAIRGARKQAGTAI